MPLKTRNIILRDNASRIITCVVYSRCHVDDYTHKSELVTISRSGVLFYSTRNASNVYYYRRE